MSHSVVTCKVAGGIWRIKWDPHGTDQILTASMYSGFHWLKYLEENCSLEIKSEFKEHDSIAYGADICYLSPAEITNNYFTTDNQKLGSNKLAKFTVTCSFYDKKLCFCIL